MAGLKFTLSYVTSFLQDNHPGFKKIIFRPALYEIYFFKEYTVLEIKCFKQYEDRNMKKLGFT